MTRTQSRKITNRVVDALRAKCKPGLTWDRDLPGFGVRSYSTDRIAYVVQCRGPSGSRRVTLGQHGDVTPDEARRLAARIIDRIKAGKEPFEKTPKPEVAHSVAELAESCVVEYVDRQCKPTTAIRYRRLMLTECRCNEILKLRWDEVDFERNELRLADSKTGQWTVPLSPAAKRVIAARPRVLGNPWVIPGKLNGRPLRNVNRAWCKVRERAGLEDVRLHDLRHSFASRALALVESLPMIGKLLGHARIQTTARYAHLAETSVRESATRISASIGADILDGTDLKYHLRQD